MSQPAIDSNRIPVAPDEPAQGNSGGPHVDPTQQFEVDGLRAYPPISTADTVEFTNGKLRALHDASGLKLFPDSSVQKIDCSWRNWVAAFRSDAPEYQIGAKLEGAFAINTPSGVVPIWASIKDGEVRHLIPQRAHRSCVYTSGSMILLDYCSKFGLSNVSDLRLINQVIGGNIGTTEVLLCLLDYALEDTGHRSRLLTLDMTPNELSNALRQGGPAAFAIGGEVGNHMIVVDAQGTGDDLFCVRDPFHGWSIHVKFDALKERVGSTVELVQIGLR